MTNWVKLNADTNPLRNIDVGFVSGGFFVDLNGDSILEFVATDEVGRTFAYSFSSSSEGLVAVSIAPAALSYDNGLNNPMSRLGSGARVEVYDVNGDGYVDLLTGFDGGFPRIFWGSGGSYFTLASNFPGANAAISYFNLSIEQGVACPPSAPTEQFSVIA